MYNDQYADAYKSWLGTMQGKTVTYYDKASGEMTSIEIPSAWDNLRYFLTYQVNFMYIRYFLWNFVGRQDDVQGNGLPDHGNWITGFSFIDRHLTTRDTTYITDFLCCWAYWVSAGSCEKDRKEISSSTSSCYCFS